MSVGWCKAVFAYAMQQCFVSQRKDIRSECDDHVFKRTKEGNKSGLSNDYREFLAIMKDEFEVESSGKWTAPLPFRSDRPKLSNNRVATERRAKTLDYNLRRDEHKMKMLPSSWEMSARLVTQN